MRYVATHPDLTCPTPANPIPDVGAFIAMFESACGRRPEAVYGKPSAAMATSALSRLGAEAAETVVIGDRLETDVRMAQAAGATAWLVLSGVASREDAEQSASGPQRVLGNLSEALALLP